MAKVFRRFLTEDDVDVSKLVPVDLTPFRAVSEPSKGFRTSSNIFINNGTNGFRMTLQDVKNLNTKILDVDKIENVDFDKLDVGDYVYSEE